MPYRLRIKPAAEQDMAEAAAWYEAERPGLAAAFLAALDEQMVRLVRDPLLYREWREGVHGVPLQRFPYNLFYLIEGEEVVVLACLHCRRNPRRWPRKA